jgi:hypothetical protein
MRIVYAGVPTETTVGRHHMSSVTGDKDAAELVMSRDVGDRTPARNPVDLDWIIRDPDAAA